MPQTFYLPQNYELRVLKEARRLDRALQALSGMDLSTSGGRAHAEIVRRDRQAFRDAQATLARVAATEAWRAQPIFRLASTPAGEFRLLTADPYTFLFQVMPVDAGSDHDIGMMLFIHRNEDFLDGVEAAFLEVLAGWP